VDRYSRLIFFMRVSNNNRAQTVLDGFLTGVKKYGLSCVVISIVVISKQYEYIFENIFIVIRTDHGGENVKLAKFMLKHRRLNRGSVMAGHSVHNQRIERLWFDVYNGVVHIFQSLFL
jgi:hypothetical protein